MAIPWIAIEDALVEWIARESGYAADRVVWSELENAPRPSGDFIELRIGDVLRRGLDEKRTLTDLGRPEGEEVELRVRGVREFSLTIQAHTDDTVGELAARATLEVIRDSLSKNSVREAFSAVGISAFDDSPVRPLNELVETNYHGRASLDVRFYVSSQVSDFVGFIATVEGENTISGTTFRASLE